MLPRSTDRSSDRDVRNPDARRLISGKALFGSSVGSREVARIPQVEPGTFHALRRERGQASESSEEARALRPKRGAAGRRECWPKRRKGPGGHNEEAE